MKVSIVINCYNYRRFVGEAIQSALQQSHEPVEVVVVDDGSTDGSQDAIAAYGDRVKTVLQTNGGQGSAYNSGFAAASGDIVLLLDADDWLYPDAARHIVQAWQSGVSKVQFPLDMTDAAGQKLGRRVPRVMHDANARDLVVRFGSYGSPPASGNAYSADFLRQVLPLDAPAWRIAADTVPILLAPLYGRVVSLPQSLGAYRLHKASSADSLAFNNATQNLWSEHKRMVRGRALVQQHLARLGQPSSAPSWFSPWEARMLVLCLRFGGQREPGAEPEPRKLWRDVLTSLWRWPDLSLPMRLAQSAWMLLMWALPLPLARRLGGLDRALKGASDAG